MHEKSKVKLEPSGPPENGHLGYGKNELNMSRDDGDLKKNNPKQIGKSPGP